MNAVRPECALDVTRVPEALAVHLQVEVAASPFGEPVPQPLLAESAGSPDIPIACDVGQHAVRACPYDSNNRSCWNVSSTPIDMLHDCTEAQILGLSEVQLEATVPCGGIVQVNPSGQRVGVEGDTTENLLY